MEKIRTLVVSMLLHALIFSCVPLILPVCNARRSFSLGSTYDMPGEEVILENSVAQYIKNLAAPKGWNAINYYGPSTAAIRICQCASGAGDTYAISFYIGHGYREQYQNGEHWHILDNNGNHVYDFLIYSYTSQRRTHFAFLWSCRQGETIGGSYDQTGYGPYGMPNAWLHTTDPQDGYAFLGWQYEGPLLRDTEGGVAQAGYKFLMNFYSSALDGNCLYAALDYASYAVWRIMHFSESPYSPLLPSVHHLMFYGDGGLVLP